MSKIPGQFTETLLQDIRVKATELMFDDRVKLQFKPNSMETMKAVLAAQTANINPYYSNPSKDNIVELIWQNACGIECGALTDCKPEAKKLSTNAMTLELTQALEAPFSIDENDMRDNVFTFEEAAAKGMLAAEARLIECISQYIIGQLNAGKGVNLHEGGKGTVIGSDTLIDPALWDASLYAYFQTVLARNRFSNAVLLTENTSLYEGFIMSQFNAGNANGKGDLSAFNSLPTYYDLFNLPAVNDPDIITYMMAMGSVAFASKAVYDTTLEVIHDHTRFSYESSLIPGLKINMLTWKECSNNYVAQVFKPYVKYDFFVNPEGCEDDNTGILTFICDTVS